MLDNYFDFEEKNQIFKNCVKIDNDGEFDKFINEILDYNVFREFQWRGMSEAKFKLYNSCQRYYDRIFYDELEENYHNFIRSINNYIHGWNNNTIVRYLEYQNIENTPVAVMSLMQHYGFPTPLLDFSENPLVALYFSSKNDNYDYNTYDIRNYSSLYLLDTKIKELEEFNKEYQINSVMGYSDQFLPLLSTKLLVISKNTPEFKLGTSINIINQSGLFIYSNHPKLPLENMLSDYNSDKSDKTVLKCWNIHKKYNSSIRLMLEREHLITSEYIFPDFYNLIHDFHKGI